MKTFEVKAEAAREGEFILGARHTGTHACYLIYGTLAPGEGGRPVKPGAGHEEIILAVRGTFEVTGALTGTLTEGQAFHVAGDTECFLRNISESDAVYVAAGGHSEGGHG
jgi:hypothetical protein